MIKMTTDILISLLDNGVTDFHGANFGYLFLDGLNFKGANLSGCIFNHTSLNRCNFENADLSGAILYSSSLVNTNLTNARLDNVSISACDCGHLIIDMDTMDKYFPSVCPSEGEFIGWKKALIVGNKVIVKLLIPSDAKRGSAFGRKCRCDKARVLSIECVDIPGKNAGRIAHSFFDQTFKYELEKEVSVDNFDEDRWHECAPGIHFFMTREEAMDYFA